MVPRSSPDVSEGRWCAGGWQAGGAGWGGVRTGRRGRARERAVAGWCARADSSFRFLTCCLNSEMLRLPEPSSSYLCRAAGGGGVRPCRGGGRDRGGCSCSSSDKCAGGAAARRRGGAWRRGGVAVRCEGVAHSLKRSNRIRTSFFEYLRAGRNAAGQRVASGPWCAAASGLGVGRGLTLRCSSSASVRRLRAGAPASRPPP